MSITSFLSPALLAINVLVSTPSLAAASGALTSTIDPCSLLTAVEEGELGLAHAIKERESSAAFSDKETRKEAPKFQSCAYKISNSTTRVVFVAPLERDGAAQQMIDELVATATPGSADYVPGAVLKEFNGGVCASLPFFGAFVVSNCLGVRENVVLWVVLRVPNLSGAPSMQAQALFEAVALRIRTANRVGNGF